MTDAQMDELRRLERTSRPIPAKELAAMDDAAAAESSRAAPEGQTVWIAWDKARHQQCWFYEREPSRHGSDGEIEFMSTGGKCDILNPSFAVYLGLAPGECRRVRLSVMPEG